MIIKQAVPGAPVQTINSQFPGLLLQTLLASGAAAAATRGMYEVGRTVTRNTAKPRSALSKQFPVLVPAEEEEKVAEKQAWDPIGGAFDVVTGELGRLSSGITDRIGNAVGDAGTHVLETLKGNKSTGLHDYPLGVAGLTAAAGAGAMGGWKLTDYILDSRRKKQLESELEASRKEYERALMPINHKQANELGQALDQLFELCQPRVSLEKQANTNYTGAYLNTLLGFGLPLSLASAYAAYGVTRAGQDKKKLLADAARQRSRRLLSSGPVFAYPQQMALPEPEGLSPGEKSAAGLGKIIGTGAKMLGMGAKVAPKVTGATRAATAAGAAGHIAPQVAPKIVGNNVGKVFALKHPPAHVPGSPVLSASPDSLRAVMAGKVKSDAKDRVWGMSAGIDDAAALWPENMHRFPKVQPPPIPRAAGRVGPPPPPVRKIVPSPAEEAAGQLSPQNTARFNQQVAAARSPPPIPKAPGMQTIPHSAGLRRVAPATPPPLPPKSLLQDPFVTGMGGMALGGAGATGGMLGAAAIDSVINGGQQPEMFRQTYTPTLPGSGLGKAGSDEPIDWDERLRKLRIRRGESPAEKSAKLSPGHTNMLTDIEWDEDLTRREAPFPGEGDLIRDRLKQWFAARPPKPGSDEESHGGRSIYDYLSSPGRGALLGAGVGGLAGAGAGGLIGAGVGGLAGATSLAPTLVGAAYGGLYGAGIGGAAGGTRRHWDNEALLGAIPKLQPGSMLAADKDGLATIKMHGKKQLSDLLLNPADVRRLGGVMRAIDGDGDGLVRDGQKGERKKVAAEKEAGTQVPAALSSDHVNLPSPFIIGEPAFGLRVQAMPWRYAGYGAGAGGLLSAATQAVGGRKRNVLGDAIHGGAIGLGGVAGQRLGALGGAYIGRGLNNSVKGIGSGALLGSLAGTVAGALYANDLVSSSRKAWNSVDQPEEEKQAAGAGLFASVPTKTLQQSLRPLPIPKPKMPAAPATPGAPAAPKALKPAAKGAVFA